MPREPRALTCPHCDTTIHLHPAREHLPGSTERYAEPAVVFCSGCHARLDVEALELSEPPPEPAVKSPATAIIQIISHPMGAQDYLLGLDAAGGLWRAEFSGRSRRAWVVRWVEVPEAN